MKYEILLNQLRDPIRLSFCTESDAVLIKEAADAIEELVRKEKFHAFLWNTIQPNEMEQYLAMYRAQAVPSEPQKEETDGN